MRTRNDRRKCCADGRGHRLKAELYRRRLRIDGAPQPWPPGAIAVRATTEAVGVGPLALGMAALPRMQLERPAILVYSASSRSGRVGKPLRTRSKGVSAQLRKALVLLRKPQ